MREFQSKMLVEFPQAFRQMLPIIVAQLVVLLKDTSLGYIVGYNEIIRNNMNNLGSFYGNRYMFSLFLVTLLSTWRSTSRCRGSLAGSRAAPRAVDQVDAAVERSPIRRPRERCSRSRRRPTSAAESRR